MRLGVKVLVTSIAVGVAAALLTGFFDSTPAGLVGARWYGYPLAWLYRLIVAPQYFPWTTDAVNLVLDIGVWCVISVAIGGLTLWLYRGQKRAF